jgi:ABC-type branched-subunit amino acid transport system substrate-binding protein
MSGVQTGLGVCAALLLLSFVAVEPPAAQRANSAGSDEAVLGGSAPVGSGGNAGKTPGRVVPGATATSGPVQGGVRPGAAPGRLPTSRAGLACRAGQNGGATDDGVTGSKIKLASTNVRSGPGSSFLGSSYVGMQAAVNRVNAKGGICGRLIDLRLVDDGWDASRGDTYLKNFIREDYFALPVVPSSEGLTQSILNQSIRKAGIPVVGTDGMLKEQYSDPWVWPVAASTVTTIRVMTKHALDNGAESFGIIYDKQYRFGREGAEAFKQYVRKITGKDPKAFIGITPGKASYSSDASAFNSACGDLQCDFVAMLLDPVTANTYISSQSEREGRKQGFGRLLTGGAQPLFNERFARDCRKACEGMLVWTGYNPPIGRLSSLPDVAEYVDDVKSVSPGTDVNNQFLEGAYLGMRVFLDALEKVGPDLTRERLRAVLNSSAFRSDLSSPLAWREDSRFANQSAQAFKILTAAGSFAGFAEEGSGFVKDPTPGVVPKD